MANDTEVGYYTLPVILSMEGVEKQVNGKLAKVFGDVGKRAGASLAGGAEAEIKRLTESYGKLRDRAQDALGKVRVEEERLAKARSGGKQDQIAAAEERLAKARRDSARINREAAASHQALTDRQKQLADQSSGTGSAIERLKRSLGSMSSSMGGPLAIAAAGATAGVAAIGAVAIRAGRELYELGSEFDNLRDKLQISTGATGAELTGLVDTVEKLGTTNTASSFADIGAVVSDVTRNLHLSGPALDDVTSRIANLNRMTGEAVNVRELGKAFRGFGVAAADQGQALNTLYEAQTKTGMSINDMVASVAKAGPALRQFGLSFGESAALVTTFEQAGVDSDKAMASLTKAFAFFSKQGIPAKQGLQTVIGEIQRLMAAGREADAGNLANQVFGGKGGVNFFELIKSGAVDLQSLSTSLQYTGLDINQTAEQTADWAERWQILKNEGIKALEPLGAAVFDVVNDKLGGLANWVEDHQDEITDFFVTMGHAAIDAGAFIVQSFGDVLSCIGQIGGALGDIQGGMLKFQAWQADIRGDTETADELRSQAEEAFGYGEGLTKMGDAMKAVDPTKLHRALDDAAAKAKGATTETGLFSSEIDKLDGNKVDIPIGVSGIDEASSELDDFFAKYSKLTVGLELGDAAAAGIMGGTALGAGLGPIVSTGQPYGLPANTNTGGYGGPGQDQFPQWVRDLGAAYGVQPSTYPGHQTGSGLNQGIDWVGTVEAMDAFAKALAASKPAGVKQVIWQNPNTGEMTGLTPSGEVVKQGGGYYRDDWASHQNHVHTLFTQSAGVAAGGLGRSAGIPLNIPIPGPAPTLTNPVPVTIANPPTATPALVPSMAIDTSRLTDYGPGGSPDLINAFGPGYEPGIGRPGYDEYGKPGYYRADPRSVRDAQQRADDARAAIAEYDAAAQAARDARAALGDDPLADPAKIAGADEDVRKAEARAATARREAADAATDAAEVAKGTFTAAREAQKQDAAKAEQKQKAGGKGSGLGGLGSIASSFLGDTFGIGDWLPALDNFWPLQAADALMGAFLTPLLSGDTATTAAATSTAPFGIPDIAAPPMPQNGQHGGSGATPGPAQIINVDQSQNFTNSPLGWDPAQVDKERQRNIQRAPRLPVGMGG